MTQWGIADTLDDGRMTVFDFEDGREDAILSQADFNEQFEVAHISRNKLFQNWLRIDSG